MAQAGDGGTRVPFVVRGPGQIRGGVSDALVSQIDVLAALAALTGQKLSPAESADSLNTRPALAGRANTARDHLVEQAGALSIIVGQWKYIEPHVGEKIDRGTNVYLTLLRSLPTINFSVYLSAALVRPTPAPNSISKPLLVVWSSTAKS